MPKALYHWSSAAPSIFNVNNPRFKVNTQGRVYAVRDRKAKFGTTKALQPNSLLVFIGDSTKIFRKHPWLTLQVFKFMLGQYWSKSFGDVVWDRADAVGHGNIWLIFNANIVPINDIKRAKHQKMKVRARIALDIGFLIAIIILIYCLRRIEVVSDTIESLISNRLLMESIFMPAVVLVILFPVIWGFWIVKRDTAPLNVDKDLQLALQKAKTRGMLPNNFYL